MFLSAFGNLYLGTLYFADLWNISDTFLSTCHDYLLLLDMALLLIQIETHTFADVTYLWSSIFIDISRKKVRLMLSTSENVFPEERRFEQNK